MAEKYLGDLLEELDNVSYSRLLYKSKPRFTVGDLIKKHIPKGLIIDAFAEDLIRDANNPHRPQTFSNNIDNSIPCILTITGFQYLNQIRIKKSIEDLNDSIDAFKKSSDSALVN